MEKVKRMRIEDRYEFVYIPKYEIIDLYYKYTDSRAFIWGMSKNNIKDIEKDFIVRLEKYRK